LLRVVLSFVYLFFSFALRKQRKKIEKLVQYKRVQRGL